MKHWKVKMFLFLAALTVMAIPGTGSGHETCSAKVISNTAIARFTTSEGVTVVIESSPEGNSIPGEGNGKPQVIIVREPGNVFSGDVENEK